MTAPPRGTRVRRQGRRGATLILAIVALVTLAVLSGATSSSAPSASAPSAATVQVGTESSATFCGGLENSPGEVRSTVAIADLAGSPRTLEVTTSNERGRVSQRLIAVRPGHVLHLDPSHLLRGTTDAMSIVADGGGVAASETVTGAGGTAVAPCLTSAAPTWYATGGSTERDHSLLVSVLNPFASTAQVTVSFLTSQGFVEPNAYKGLDLRPHELVVLDVHDVAPRQAPITTEVTTVAGTSQSGNVVVYAVNRSSSGAGSLSVLPGTPGLATGATFARTPNQPDASTRLVLANPSTTSVTATVRVDWSPGCGAHCAAPIGITVGSGSTSSLLVAPSSRTPTGVGTATVLSATAPGLVVVQNVRSPTSRGQSAAIDDPTGVGADNLVLVEPTGSGFDRVSLANTGAAAVTVTMESPGPSGLRVWRTATVAAGGVTTISGHALRWLVGGVLQLVSTGPVYATGEVNDALLGSDLLAAAPVG
jgi:Family of unknown function (DUF5719)